MAFHFVLSAPKVFGVSVEPWRDRKFEEQNQGHAKVIRLLRKPSGMPAGILFQPRRRLRSCLEILSRDILSSYDFFEMDRAVGEKRIHRGWVEMGADDRGLERRSAQSIKCLVYLGVLG